MPAPDPQLPDAAYWHGAWAPWEGATWRALPWFFAETYFYRLLLESVRYVAEGPWHGVDPFGPPKRAALTEGLPELAVFVEALHAMTERAERFARWFHRALWGNRADLSNVVSGGTFDAAVRAGVLVDHTAEVWTLVSQGLERVDVVADNAGPELLVDLGLIAFLLEEGLVRQVHLHLKPTPFFVSDATVPDFRETVAALERSSQAACAASPHAYGMPRPGAAHAHDHAFWTQPLFHRAAGGPARRAGAGGLLILKGDLTTAGCWRTDTGPPPRTRQR